MRRLDRAYPVPVSAGACLLPTCDRTYVYVGGGYANGTFHNDLLAGRPKERLLVAASVPRLTSTLSLRRCTLTAGFTTWAGFGSGLVTDTTRIYDIATNMLDTGAPMPDTLWAPATVLWNGVVYVAGGNTVGGEDKHALRL